MKRNGNGRRITFCGITMKNYVEGNISPKSHTTVKYAMKMLSSSSETIIFMFLGVNTVHDHHEWNTAFILLTILFCSVCRAIGVVILTEVTNSNRPINTIRSEMLSNRPMSNSSEPSKWSATLALLSVGQPLPVAQVGPRREVRHVVRRPARRRGLRPGAAHQQGKGEECSSFLFQQHDWWRGVVTPMGVLN